MSKAALWLAGTIAGAILGYVCMVSPDLATNPYGLMTIICTFTFIVGALTMHQVCECGRVHATHQAHLLHTNPCGLDMQAVSSSVTFTHA